MAAGHVGLAGLLVQVPAGRALITVVHAAGVPDNGAISLLPPGLGRRGAAPEGGRDVETRVS